MKVLDLFSGLGGFSQAFKDREHDVTTLDNNPKFNPTVCMNLLNLKPSGESDVILASPPCECFSVASIGKHWKDGKPDKETLEAIELVKYYTKFHY